MNDIRDARFYVVEDGDSHSDAEPLKFDDAFARARTLVSGGSSVTVFYTEEATQTEITRFVSEGFPASLVSGA